MPYFALLDDAQTNHATYYSDYVRSDFITAQQLHRLDDLLQQGWQNQLHVVMTIDYEWGLPLMQLPSPQTGYLALHWFAQQHPIANTHQWLQQHASQQISGISTPQANTQEADYLAHIQRIQHAIAQGDCYQINYTIRLHLQAYGDPIRLYQRLRQPVPYAVLAHLPNAQQTDRWTLCFSPELFLKISPQGVLTTEPMKGTAPILNDGQNETRAQTLQNDPKNRAENVMIVDLLRNDLGKIAQIGGVHVPEPFKVSRFGSVWQMTSRIEAHALPHTRMTDILRAAFPCGSITGAPKRMSMHLINDLESEPRDIYTGSIGYLNPCSQGLGFEGVLNVVIRTLQLTPQADGSYQGVYGVGSGIVTDSVPQDEYHECAWKARFLQHLPAECSVFETMRVVQHTCDLLPLHLARLQQSANALNLPFTQHDVTLIQHYLQQLPSTQAYRVKAELHPTQGLQLSHMPLQPLSDTVYVLLSHQRLPQQDYLRRFKTNQRHIFDAAWQHAEQYGAFDGLLFNENDVLLEGGRSNVFVRFGQHWHTPALDLDILNGVMRQAILANPQDYLNTPTVFESHISRTQLQQADEIWISNALRGLLKVTPISS